MNIVEVAQITGTIAIFLLFCIKFYVAVNEHLFYRVGRAAILWTTIYIFFLFALRTLSLFNIGTADELRVISGFTALIPLFGVVVHLTLQSRIDRNV